MKSLNKKIYIFLWLGCLIGSWAIIPYTRSLIPSTVSLGKLFLIITLQTAILYAAVLWLASLILPNTDLEPFASSNLIKRIIIPGIISGVFVGLIIVLFEHLLFQSSLLSGKHAPIWQGALASLYGAINEEVLLRLFLFSLIYFLLNKIYRSPVKKRIYLLWATNIFTALLFGLGHLPAAFKLISPSGFEISRILLLNGIPGLVFGWLYWSKGLWTAMFAHFVTDLMLHVILI